MWKKILLGVACLALLAAPAAFAREWLAVYTETTSAGSGKPTLAGTSTPIGSGVFHARIVALTNPAWIIFQSPIAYNATALNGRMSELGFLVPINVEQIVRVPATAQWHVQGEGGTSTVSVTQISQ